jgi:hypothetical protein
MILGEEGINNDTLFPLFDDDVSQVSCRVIPMLTQTGISW